MAATTSDPDSAAAAKNTLFDDAFLRRLERLSLLANTPPRGATAGEHTRLRSGAGLEFYDYRRYRTGDDVRLIDWNVSARLDQLFIKLLAAEVDTTLNLLIDVSTSMDFGTPTKFNYALQLAAALAVIGLSGADRVAITLFDSQLGTGLPLMKGKGHLRTILQFLSDSKPDGNTHFTTPFTDVVANRASPGVLVVISDLLGDFDTLKALHALQSSRLDVIVLQILAEEELNPSLSGVLRLIDAESTVALNSTVDDELITLYQQQLQTHLQTIEQTCRRLGFVHLRTTTSQPLESFILRDLQYQHRYRSRRKAYKA